MTDTYTTAQIVRKLRKQMVVDVTSADIERIKNACKRHTPSPEGYREWHAWAGKMSRTHRQIRCEGCGLWAIWIPKVKRKPTRRLPETTLDKRGGNK